MSSNFSPVWGAAIGGGLSATATIGTRVLKPSWAGKAEYIGAGVGTGAALILLSMKKTRMLGWGALAGTLAASLPRVLERLMGGGQVSGLSIRDAVALQGLSVQNQNTPVLGQHQQQTHFQGPAQLSNAAQNGFGSNPAASQMQGIMPLNGLAGRFGATLVGGN